MMPEEQAHLYTPSGIEGVAHTWQEDPKAMLRAGGATRLAELAAGTPFRYPKKENSVANQELARRVLQHVDGAEVGRERPQPTPAAAHHPPQAAAHHPGRLWRSALGPGLAWRVADCTPLDAGAWAAGRQARGAGACGGGARGAAAQRAAGGGHGHAAQDHLAGIYLAHASPTSPLHLPHHSARPSGRRRACTAARRRPSSGASGGSRSSTTAAPTWRRCARPRSPRSRSAACSSRHRGP